MSGEDPTIPDGGSDEESVGSGSQWQPNAGYLQTLLDMGITENAARRGLYHTDNESVDAATTFIFEQPSNEMNLPFDPATTDDEEEGPAYKMVFVVNTELGMGAGKIAAQCAHGALGMYRDMLQNTEDWTRACEDWEEDGAERTIVLKAENEAALHSLYLKARDHELLTNLVDDAGLTQVPEGAKTVLGIFGEETLVDEVTGSLKLL